MEMWCTCACCKRVKHQLGIWTLVVNSHITLVKTWTLNSRLRYKKDWLSNNVSRDEILPLTCYSLSLTISQTQQDLSDADGNVVVAAGTIYPCLMKGYQPVSTAFAQYTQHHAVNDFESTDLEFSFTHVLQGSETPASLHMMKDDTIAVKHKT